MERTVFSCCPDLFDVVVALELGGSGVQVDVVPVGRRVGQLDVRQTRVQLRRRHLTDQIPAGWFTRVCRRASQKARSSLYGAVVFVLPQELVPVTN